jgi:hypothetical protein
MAASSSRPLDGDRMIDGTADRELLAAESLHTLRLPIPINYLAHGISIALASIISTTRCTHMQSFRPTDLGLLRSFRPRHFLAPTPTSAGPQTAPETSKRGRNWYVPVRAKFALSLATATVWFALSWWIALPWIHELSAIVGRFLAYAAIGGIALVPGFMNGFLAVSLLIDRRPRAPRLQATRVCRF